MSFKPNRWTFVLLVLLITLSAGAFFFISLSPEFFKSDFKAQFLGAFSQNPFRKQSEVKVSSIDSKINLNFDLTQEDKPKLKAFVRNWFDDSEDISSLSIGIDENLKRMLSANLPADLNLEISPKSLGFSSNLMPGLQNALIKSDFKFATGSGRLDIQFTNPSKYELKIDNPSDLANYATSSGMLIVSSKIDRLFKTLPKVATISLSVNGKNISGQIVLK